MSDDTMTTSVTTSVVGTLRPGDRAIRMENTFDTDISDLWSALTDPMRLARWIGDVKGDLRLGGDFQARFTSTWEGPGRVDVCEPPSRLRVTMSPGEDDETVIEASLAVVGDRTALVIDERGLPLADLAAYGAGWQAHIEDLAAYLGGREPGDWRTRWAELIPSYRDHAARPA